MGARQSSRRARIRHEPFLPPAVSFGSHQWTTLITLVPPRVARRPAVNRPETRNMKSQHPSPRTPSQSGEQVLEWRDGFAWLAGGTWRYSEPQPGIDTLIPS